ncbi:MAG: hypothetical protein M3290_04780, partial [Actinomycetota bacterium]|nr:hypothetical protein [Actinomycetota bacterium]
MTDRLVAQPVDSFDGSEIAMYTFGDGDATPLLVCNAVGADLSMWRRALIDVERARRVVTWDHRGLHESGPPATPRLDAGAHAEDA